MGAEYSTFETDQPWIVYRYGRTHDRWWPVWSSTRVLGRACIVAQCAVCGDATPMWIRMRRFGRIVDNGHHPKRLAYLAEHLHPDRGAPMSWKRPLLNWVAHPAGVDLDALAMRLEADLNEDRCTCDGLYGSGFGRCTKHGKP
jgi:hypothetical protein